MKRILPVAAILLVVTIAAISIATARISSFLDTPVVLDDGGESFTIEPGMSFGSIAANLQQNGLISSADMLSYYARWTEKAGRVHAGEYFIADGASPREILEQFTSGAVQLYSFTIIEGWNRWDLLRALHSDPNMDASMTDEDWPALLDELGAETTHPEGLFLPETYHFPSNSSDRAVLRQAFELLQKTLTEEWAEKSESTVVSSPYEALILASIIEKETARADERQRIAGVFTRRLEMRMRLQTDPTVIYGIGRDFNGNLTRTDMRTATPYNTYTQRGLPPTPIAMSGRAAIHAALHPAEGEELYFVATGNGDGSHKFSASKEEHDDAVAAYLRQLRSNRHKDQ